MHDLSENTKRAIDIGSYTLAAVAAVSLTQTALIVSILAGLMSIAWTAMRFYDRMKYGRSRAE